MTAHRITGVTSLLARTRRRADDLRKLARLPGDFSTYVRPHRRNLALAMLLSVAYAGIRLLEPWPIQILFDQVLLGKKAHFLGIDPMVALGDNRGLLIVVCSGAILLIALISGSLYYTQSILLAGVGQRIVQDLRRDLFHQLQRLSLAFHRRARSGDILMRLTGDMILLREMILASLVTLTSQSLLMLSVLILMITVSWRLTLMAILLGPALFFLLRFFRGRMLQAARQQRKREGAIATALEEVLSAIPMIQSYTAEEIEDERFRSMSKRSARAGLRAARLEAGMQRMVEIVLASSTGLVLLMGIREVVSNRITPGLLLVFLAYLRSLYKPIRTIAKVTERTARAAAARERVLEVLHARREIKDSKTAIPAPHLRGEIEFDNVDFAYEDGSVALRDVSFRIRPGDRVALVGPTGAGKSTLLSLILRFHRPTAGEIRIDGTRHKRYTLASLRRQIAFLPQDASVIGSTIRENLLYGRPEATDEELYAALEAVGLAGHVAGLQGGLDAPIAPRGTSLSGGQRQSLAIARAFLKDAPIILLDEPTTALDARSEEQVLTSLEHLIRGRTVITIAHRFHSIRHADRVLVLEAGRLVEDSTPSDLLTEPSLFRLLAEIQGFDLPLPTQGDSRGGSALTNAPS